MIFVTADFAENECRGTGEACPKRSVTLISVPFQNNTNLNFGPERYAKRSQHPAGNPSFSVNDDWNIITRTIIVISMPSLYPGDDRTNGIGDIQFTAFLSPANPGECLGRRGDRSVAHQQQWELGNDTGAWDPVRGAPSQQRQPWVYGMLVSNVWSLTSDGGRLVQQRPDSTLPQLQLQEWFLPDQRADPDRELEGRQRPAVDRTSGRCIGKIFSSASYR